MASTILVKDILYRASVEMLDASPQFVRYTERELVSWFNDAQRLIAKFLPHSCSRVDVIKLIAGTRQCIKTISSGNMISGDGAASSNVTGRYLLEVYRNMGSDGLTPGPAIRLLNRAKLDMNRSQWHSEVGSPISGYTFDPRAPTFFHVYPKAAAPLPWVEVAYLFTPADVPSPGIGTLYAMDGASVAVISVDDLYADDVLNYILARAHLKEAEFSGNMATAKHFTDLVNTSINAQARALTGVNPNLNVLPMTPDLAASAQ